MRVPPKIYSAEFKADAVALACRTDRTLREVAADLGVNHWTLRGWYKADKMAKQPRKAAKSVGVSKQPAVGEETPEQRLARAERENERLRKENDQLRMDREILKKAAAFFAKESE